MAQTSIDVMVDILTVFGADSTTIATLAPHVETGGKMDWLNSVPPEAVAGLFFGVPDMTPIVKYHTARMATPQPLEKPVDPPLPPSPLSVLLPDIPVEAPVEEKDAK